MNYDESDVVVYGSGFVCHDSLLVVCAQMMMMMMVIKIRCREGAMWCRYPLIALICLLVPVSSLLGNNKLNGKLKMTQSGWNQPS